LLHKTSRIKYTFALLTLPYINDYLSKQFLFRNNEVKKNRDGEKQWSSAVFFNLFEVAEPKMTPQKFAEPK
jgi:hypothetical protein